MTISFEYDESAAAKADSLANRIEQGPSIGTFTMVNSITAGTGAEGVHFEFEGEDGGKTGFDLYTMKDGKPLFGMNFIQAMQTILGLRGLKSVPGKHEAWVEGKREEVSGEIFPDLMNKPIGIVMQKELYTKQDGNDASRFNLAGVFHPKTKLLASEIREKKAAPEKLDKMLRSLKTKDSRKPRAAEPAQPSVGADAGSY
jgi:hypothetical protein